MCGISGIIYKNKNRQINPNELEIANNTLTHRGPDDSGIFIEGHVGIAMRRLSIIDVAEGHQPISNGDNSIHIVFNGEIYNHQKIRKNLIAKGHCFKTQTDTETILHNYEEKNWQTIHDLNGMFAFAIWDSNIQRLLIVRDRLGIKPLYYYEDDEKLIFASEIKAILSFNNVNKEIDNHAIFDYFTFNYIPAPRTIYKNIKKLPPGHSIHITSDTIKKYKYWDVEYNINNSWNISSATNQLEELLFDAVKIRLMSEVPLGAFLSGGIDSSSICNIITSQKLKDELHTFSIGFDTYSQYNELSFSSMMAKKISTQHHTKIILPDMINLLPEIVKQLDEPMSDTSNIPTYLLSQFAKSQVTVALSGDGGDELFAGYERQKVLNILKYFNSLPKFITKKIFSSINASEQKDTLFDSIKRLLFDISQGSSATYKRWITNFNSSLMTQILNPGLQEDYINYNIYKIVDQCFQYSKLPINQSLAFETKYYLPDDLLVKVDRMSMAHSLEVRVPFLDHRIVEFAATLPINYKIRNGQTKYLLKQSMGRYLPKDIIKKPKQGFTPPIKEWLKNDLKDFTMDLLLSSKKINDYIQYDKIEELLISHYSGKRDYQYQIWSLLVLVLWLE